MLNFIVRYVQFEVVLFTNECRAKPVKGWCFLGCSKEPVPAGKDYDIAFVVLVAPDLFFEGIQVYGLRQHEEVRQFGISNPFSYGVLNNRNLLRAKSGDCA